MATKREILESLPHKDLLVLAENFEMSIENKRRKGNVSRSKIRFETVLKRKIH